MALLKKGDEFEAPEGFDAPWATPVKPVKSKAEVNTEAKAKAEAEAKAKVEAEAKAKAEAEAKAKAKTKAKAKPAETDEAVQAPY